MISMRRMVMYQPPTEAGGAYSDADGREQIWLPHGLLCVAAMLDPSRWEVELVDGRLAPNGNLKRLQDRLAHAHVLACSVMTGHAIRWALQASVLAKSNGVAVVWGGPHPTLFPEQTIASPLVDYVIIGGRGEDGFSEWAKAIDADRPFPPSSGIGFKQSGASTLLRRDPSISMPPRDSLPPPRLDLIQDHSPYLMNDPAVANKTTNHVTSVGCPYACIFCSEPELSGRRWHAWSAERSVKEIARVVEASGATGVKLHDALFFVDMKRALRFAQEIEPLSLKWAATMHPVALSRMSPNDLALLARSGLSRLMLGLESGNQFVVDLVGKKYRVNDIPAMAEKLRDARIVGMFSFVVGFPTAPAAEYPDTINAAHAIHRVWDRHQVKIHYASPWPGTDLWRLAAAIPGFSPPTTLEGWSEYDYYLAQMTYHDRSWESEISEINRAYCPYFHS